MLIHSVFFWLKPEVSAADRAEFRRSVEGLRTIESISQAYIGTPAPIGDFANIERSFSVALTTLFKDISAHDAYQVHPVHVKFVADNKKYLAKVVAYDAQ